MIAAAVKQTPAVTSACTAKTDIAWRHVGLAPFRLGIMPMAALGQEATSRRCTRLGN
jgi:hypothetical protein